MTEAQRKGWLYGLAAYFIWGSFPLYFHFLRDVAPGQVIAQRIVWSALLCLGLILVLKRVPRVKQAWQNKKALGALLASGLLVGGNWLIFVAAVGRGEVLACSLGYFLTPLVSVLLARMILREQLTRLQGVAVALASAGVAYFVLALGTLPWVSLSLAITFGLYGLIRKQTPVGPLTGLWLETLFLSPLALGYLLWCSWQGDNDFLQHGPSTTALLIGSGLLTTLPLLAFAAAAQRLSLTIVGFMMYINPVMQFLTAVFILQETYSQVQVVTFALIFLALAVFSLDSYRQHRRAPRP